MFTLIQHAHVFAPKDLGVCDILIADRKIAMIAPEIDITGLDMDVVDLDGSRLVPGFIDNHVHITGGGGEGGFSTRTPELPLSAVTACGVTTVCGLLGTDGVTRSLPNLLAKARGLEAEGITAYIYSGAYQVPTPTFTGSLRSDLMIIDKVIGAGEIALSDHRSAQPTWQEYVNIVAQVRVGGMLAGKAGIVDFHTGDGNRHLDYLRKIVSDTELPYTNMLPTHINRNSHLFEDAIDYAQGGGFVDVTSGVNPQNSAPDAVQPSAAIRRLLDAGVELSHILMSSDGNGSVPLFDDKGNNIGVGVADQASLLTEMRDAVQKEGVDFSAALSIITKNVADLYHFSHKGEIEVGRDADLVALTDDYEVAHVWANGRRMVKDGAPIVFGTFEQR